MNHSVKSTAEFGGGASHKLGPAKYWRPRFGGACSPRPHGETAIDDKCQFEPRTSALDMTLPAAAARARAADVRAGAGSCTL